MRVFLIAACMMVSAAISAPAWAQNCKPDMSREDRISKEHIDVWAQTLFATSFGSSLMSTSDVGITATIGRYGSVNAINIQLQKREESLENAGFESAYRAAVGTPFVFGFQTGDPVALVVTSVSNQANVQNGLFSAKGVTSVVLSAVIPDANLAALRATLTERQVDAVRLTLAGDLRIEKSVNEKNGRKMMEKFSCFFRALDAKGIDLAASSGLNAQPAAAGAPGGAPSSDPISVQGKYVFTSGIGSPSDFTELSTDGRFFMQEGGKGVAGTYTVLGDTVTLAIPSGQAFRVRLNGNRMVQPDGTVLERVADLPASPNQPGALTVEQIIQMVAAKLPDDVVIMAIRNAGMMFTLGPDVLIKLKTAGVSDDVIRAMTR